MAKPYGLRLTVKFPVLLHSRTMRSLRWLLGMKSTPCKNRKGSSALRSVFMYLTGYRTQRSGLFSSREEISGFKLSLCITTVYERFKLGHRIVYANRFFCRIALIRCSVFWGFANCADFTKILFQDSLWSASLKVWTWCRSCALVDNRHRHFLKQYVACRKDATSCEEFFLVSWY